MWNFQLFSGWKITLQSNLAIRNFLVALNLFLNAKSSLSLWSKWQIGHREWFLNTNLVLTIKPFLIAKFDCIIKLIRTNEMCGNLIFCWFCTRKHEKKTLSEVGYILYQNCRHLQYCHNSPAFEAVENSPTILNVSYTWYKSFSKRTHKKSSQAALQNGEQSSQSGAVVSTLSSKMF